MSLPDPMRPVAPGMRPLYPGVAALLGFLFPGGGQIYCGQRTRGAIILTVAIVTLFGCGFWNLYGAWSGYFLAKRLHHAKPFPNRERGDAGELAEAALDLLD